MVVIQHVRLVLEPILLPLIVHEQIQRLIMSRGVIQEHQLRGLTIVVMGREHPVQDQGSLLAIQDTLLQAVLLGVETINLQGLQGHQVQVLHLVQEVQVRRERIIRVEVVLVHQVEDQVQAQRIQEARLDLDRIRRRLLDQHRRLRGLRHQEVRLLHQDHLGLGAQQEVQEQDNFNKKFKLDEYESFKYLYGGIVVS